jgi:hypothetical protein
MGKLRVYSALYQALDLLVVPDPPRFLPELIETLKQMIAVQQTMLYSQVATPGSVGKEVALDAFARSKADVEVKVQGVQTEVMRTKEELGGRVTAAEKTVQEGIGRVDGKIEEVEADLDRVVSEQVMSLQGDVGFLKGQMDQIDTHVLGEGGRLQQLDKGLKAVEGQIGAFAVEGVEPSNIKGKLVMLDSINARVLALEGQ